MRKVMTPIMEQVLEMANRHKTTKPSDLEKLVRIEYGYVHHINFSRIVTSLKRQGKL